MTTAETTSDLTASAAHDDAADEPELCWLAVADLRSHPDNPRTSVGDLSELTRSIRARGVLQPLLVLPANDDGVHFIAAGMRRHAAALRAGLAQVPAVVRPMTTIEVIEAGLSENGNRTDLTLSEEIGAIERLMSLGTGVTPAKLCKRIGRSQAWVRSRMAVTILPGRWRNALDHGEFSLAAAEAAAAAADLGPEHLDAVCERLTDRHWPEPARIVADYREGLRRVDAYERAVAKALARHPIVFNDGEPAPASSKRLGELFDADGATAHVAEPCHAVVVHAQSWGDGVETWDVCIDPGRHNPDRVGASGGSDLATDYSAPRHEPGGGADSQARRKARVARLAHATDTFAKTRGGFSQSDLTRLALHCLIREAGQDALKFAATMLGHTQPREANAQQLLDNVDGHPALVRVAGAVALGTAESHMYWSSHSPRCRAYLDALMASGWTPDEHTAALIDHNTASIAERDADGGNDAPHHDCDANTGDG